MEHTITPTLAQLTEELARVKAHLEHMDDLYDSAMVDLDNTIRDRDHAQHLLDATYPWLRQLYAMWPNQYLKDFLSAAREF